MRARELTFNKDNGRPPPCVTCHVPGVTCRKTVSFSFYLLSFLGQSDGASWLRVCCQQGLTRLVINRADVARAVLQSSFYYFLNSLIKLLSDLFVQNCPDTVHPKL